MREDLRRILDKTKFKFSFDARVRPKFCTSDIQSMLLAVTWDNEFDINCNLANISELFEDYGISDDSELQPWFGSMINAFITRQSIALQHAEWDSETASVLSELKSRFNWEIDDIGDEGQIILPKYRMFSHYSIVGKHVYIHGY